MRGTASRYRAPMAPGFDLSKNSPLVTRGWRALDECLVGSPFGGAQPSARRGEFLLRPAWEPRRRRGGSIRTTDLSTATVPVTDFPDRSNRG